MSFTVFGKGRGLQAAMGPKACLGRKVPGQSLAPKPIEMSLKLSRRDIEILKTRVVKYAPPRQEAFKSLGDLKPNQKVKETTLHAVGFLNLTHGFSDNAAQSYGSATHRSLMPELGSIYRAEGHALIYNAQRFLEAPVEEITTLQKGSLRSTYAETQVAECPWKVSLALAQSLDAASQRAACRWPPVLPHQDHQYCPLA